MRLFLLGAPCAGKTTLMAPLRGELGCPVLDMDQEIRRVNHGAWPQLAAKRGQTLQIMTELSELDEVVLAYSLLDEEGLELLRARQWSLVLLDLPESVMRQRAADRERAEGWSNVWWLPGHLDNIERLREKDAFDGLIDAVQPVPDVVGAVVAYFRGH